MKTIAVLAAVGAVISSTMSIANVISTPELAANDWFIVAITLLIVSSVLSNGKGT